MNLWLLRPIDEIRYSRDHEKNPWRFDYDRTYGFVIRAENEAQARQVASADSEDETKIAWLDAQMTSCVELETDGAADIIMTDYLAG